MVSFRLFAAACLIPLLSSLPALAGPADARKVDDPQPPLVTPVARAPAAVLAELRMEIARQQSSRNDTETTISSTSTQTISIPPSTTSVTTTSKSRTRNSSSETRPKSIETVTHSSTQGTPSHHPISTGSSTTPRPHTHTSETSSFSISSKSSTSSSFSFPSSTTSSESKSHRFHSKSSSSSNFFSSATSLSSSRRVHSSPSSPDVSHNSHGSPTPPTRTPKPSSKTVVRTTVLGNGQTSTMTTVKLVTPAAPEFTGGDSPSLQTNAAEPIVRRPAGGEAVALLGGAIGAAWFL